MKQKENINWPIIFYIIFVQKYILSWNVTSEMASLWTKRCAATGTPFGDFTIWNHGFLKFKCKSIEPESWGLRKQLNHNKNSVCHKIIHTYTYICHLAHTHPNSKKKVQNGGKKWKFMSPLKHKISHKARDEWKCDVICIGLRCVKFRLNHSPMHVVQYHKIFSDRCVRILLELFSSAKK